MSNSESGNEKKTEVRKDKVNNKWVIFSPARAKRPSDFKSKSPTPPPTTTDENCPFCLGHEHLCAPEIFRISSPTSNDNWTVRAVQNLYPALDRNIKPPTFRVSDDSDLVVLSGFGFHDVVIETPSHLIHLSDLSDKEIAVVILAYKMRIEQLSIHLSIQYIQVFKNHGASAGASLSHSHSQIMALPIIPPLVSSRLDSMRRHFEQTGNCSVCELQSKEDLLIDESIHFISLVPFAASFPFEMWIIPRDHTSHFHEINTDKAEDLGGLLKLMLRKMNIQLNNPPFNFMIHTSPLRANISELSYAHWFLQIIPQLTGIAGFELGTGSYLNPVFPEDAAKILRGVNMPVKA